MNESRPKKNKIREKKRGREETRGRYTLQNFLELILVQFDFFIIFIYLSINIHSWKLKKN